MSEVEIGASEWNERVARLERRERRMTGVSVLLLLLVLVQMVWHIVPGTGPVVASAFVLQRAQDPSRAMLYVGKDGTPCFRLNDPRGEARVLWNLRPDGTVSLRQLDQHFVTRTEMLVDSNGNPAMVLSGPDGRHAVRLAVDAGGRGFVDHDAPPLH